MNAYAQYFLKLVYELIKFSKMDNDIRCYSRFLGNGIFAKGED